MPIDHSEDFTYQGYTLGGDLPTLYFAEGRYTQVHDIPENVGWHPLHTLHVVRINITPAAVQEWLALRNRADETAFATRVVAGNYTDNSAAGTLCECYTDDNVNYQTHVSRAKFIPVGDAAANPAYDNGYALGVLSVGDLAPNEMQQID